jgi:penicillin-binding protein 2
MLNKNSSNLKIKSLWFYSVSVLMFLTLSMAYFNVQIKQGADYLNTSAKNVVKEQDIQPTRGDIYDRDNNIIIDNRPAFSLYISPRILKQDTVALKKLKLIINDTNINYKRIYKKRYASSEKVLLKRHISEKLIATLLENKRYLPGVFIESDPKRNREGEINAGHILGFVSEINDQELVTKTQFKAGDIIGKDGLEGFYNSVIFGEKGKKSFVYDAVGNIVSNLNSEYAYEELEVDGKDLYTTLDSRMQFIAESLLVDKKGSIVAIDVRDGGILAMASSPTYDPELRSKTISKELWQNLMDEKNGRPLLNRSIQGLYPPGSTYKMIAGLTAINEHIVDESWTVFCPGYFKLGNKIIRCWNHKGHGNVNMVSAIKGSCNVYFYNLGLKIGINNWEEYSKTFLFGTASGVDIPYEGSGLVPSAAYYKKRKDGYTSGKLANLAIGQGELLVTTLQMAQFIMILANEGAYYKPHFLRGFSDKYSKDITYYEGDRLRISKKISQKAWDLIKEGMFDCVNAAYGATGAVARLPTILVAGKTGTAQVPPRDPHAWFTCFAPYRKPEIAIVVLIENGKAGGAVAGPIARALLEQYFYGYVKPTRIKIKAEDERIEIPDLELPNVEVQIPLNREDD